LCILKNDSFAKFETYDAGGLFWGIAQAMTFYSRLLKQRENKDLQDYEPCSQNV
jgi:hypothetical protein